MVDDIAPIYKFLCTDGAWFNGQVSSEERDLLYIAESLTCCDRHYSLTGVTQPDKWIASVAEQNLYVS